MLEFASQSNGEQAVSPVTHRISRQQGEGIDHVAAI
jgi:hypothetical protein